MSVPQAHNTDRNAVYTAEYDIWWEKKWEEGVEAGKLWDMGEPHKALIQLLDRERFNIKDKRVLIPGCGRGYDAILLAERGGDVVGFDIADLAMTEARSYLEEYNRKKNTEVKVTYKTVNFFAFEGVYDVGYDYTFLCAIHPDFRRAWAEKWAELLVPGGLLLTIVFPIVPDKKGGPPWHIDQALVTELLHEEFDLVFEEKVPDELSEPRRAGHEALMLWKKK